MRFSLLPAGTPDTASSRIRVYALAASLCRMGYDAATVYRPDTEVFFFQKRLRGGLLEAARRAKAAGHIVMYDVDDLGDALWAWVDPRDFYDMTRLADAVTTDTVAHAELLRSRFGVPVVEVVPDSIDYDPPAPQPPGGTSAGGSGQLRILWFGCVPNVPLFARYAGVMADIPGVTVVAATHAQGIAEYADRHPTVEFVPWSRHGFATLLRSCDLTCLMHDGNVADRAKSNNRMITSITWGVPAIVSATPEYQRTAREAGVEPAVFHDESDLRRAVEHYRTAASRAGYLRRAQPIIWAKYRAEVVAKDFVAMVERLRERREHRKYAATAQICGTAQNGIASDLRFAFWRVRSADNRLAAVGEMAGKAARRAVCRVLAPNRRALLRSNEAAPAKTQHTS